MLNMLCMLHPCLASHHASTYAQPMHSLGGASAETLPEAQTSWVAAGRFTGSPYICFVSSRFFLKLIHWYNSFFGPSSVDPERGLQQNKLFHGMMDFTSFSQSCFCGSNSPNWLWIIPWFGIKPHFIYGTSVWPLRGSCQMVPIPLRGLSSWIHGRSLNTDSHELSYPNFISHDKLKLDPSRYGSVWKWAIHSYPKSMVILFPMKWPQMGGVPTFSSTHMIFVCINDISGYISQYIPLIPKNFRVEFLFWCSTRLIFGQEDPESPGPSIPMKNPNRKKNHEKTRISVYMYLGKL